MVNWIVSSSILIIGVLIIRAVLRGKISPCIQYALWGIVLLRLLIPFNIGSSRISTENLVNDISAAYKEEVLREEIGHDMKDDSGMYFMNEVKKDEPDIKAEVFTDSVQTEQKVEYAAESVASNDVMASNATVETEHEVNLIRCIGNFIEAVIPYTDIIGTMVVAVCFMCTNIRFAGCIKKGRKLIVPKKKGRLPIYFSEGIETPCMYGIIRPAIYVDSETLNNEQVFKHVEMHELTHYRHGDGVWGVLRFVVLAVHWYNPLVWMAAIISRKDSELACDAGTVRRLGEPERLNYGITLINMSCKKNDKLLAMASTMAGSKKCIQERVTFIARKPKTIFRSFVAGVLALMFVIGGTFTGAVNAADISPTKTEEDIMQLTSDAADNMATDDTVTVEPAEVDILSEKSYKVADTGKKGNNIIYGVEGSIMETLADRLDYSFVPLDDEMLSDLLAAGIYYLHNGEEVRITVERANRCNAVKDISCNKHSIENLIAMLDSYSWKQIDSIDTENGVNSVLLSMQGIIYNIVYMKFYDIGAGVVDCYNNGRHTYWEAVPLSETHTSIVKDFISEYYNGNIEISSVILDGSIHAVEVVDYFARTVYPSIRTEFTSYNVTGRSSSPVENDAFKGEIRFNYMFKAARKEVSGSLTYYAQRTANGDWCFEYYENGVTFR